MIEDFVQIGESLGKIMSTYFSSKYLTRNKMVELYMK